MFLFNKQKPKEEVEVRVCYKCGYLFETGGKEIEVRWYGTIEKRIFCKNCTPNYDYIYELLSKHSMLETRYFRHQPDIEVNKKGEPIKKK